MKLSQKFLDFSAEIAVSVPYLNTNKVRLGVSDAQITALQDYKSNWGTLMDKYIDPEQHVESVVHDVQTLYTTFHHYLEGVKQQIKNNKTWELTGDDYTSIHIHIDQGHRGHIPRPTVSPANQEIKTSHLVKKIFTSNPQPGKENDVSLPVDVAKIGRKLAVAAATAPAPGPEQYHTLESIGTAIYDLVFAPEQAGAMGYLITYYINSRGEEGPPSEPFSFRII